MKKVLFVVYSSPAGSIWINEAFRSAFGMYGQDLEPAVLFKDEAVLAVHANCKPEGVGCLPLSITFKYIEKYQTQIYATAEDLAKYGVKDNEMEPHWNLTKTTEAELPALVHSFDTVIFF
ncbi:MAG: DsrE family protein [Candidatus Cryosericum sp.]